MKKFVWEFLNGPLKCKMEVCWSDITAIEAVMIPNQSGCLRIELAKPPLFFREIPPQPQNRTTWEPADDFTNGQAQFCRKHEATFPPGALDKHYEKLLISDGRLAELSRRPFPTNESVFPLQQIPQPQLSPSVSPLQHIPKQQFHHSLNSNIIAASASCNGVNGNRINNEPTFVDSSRQDHPLDLDQRLSQYNDMAVNSKPTSVASSSQNPLAVPAPTFVESSRQNHPLVVPDQRLYQHNEPTFVCQSSQNPVVAPTSTYVDQSSSQNSSVVTDQHLYERSDTFVPFIPPPGSCRPKFHHGPIEAQYLVQNGADAGEQALAEATNGCKCNV
ncbi:uncharacterized protein LOC121800384 [Salvia splendens]|uniref:uncharacterized protein LOC121800384 n=1 Tax=Salvia splendens TaxID=180675 RepID=UPI001C26C89D|nr:uncharacterized protein LOC121800384 [Salvia splendens]